MINPKYFLFKFNNLTNKIKLVTKGKTKKEINNNILSKSLNPTNEFILLTLNYIKEFGGKDPLNIIGGPIKISFQMLELRPNKLKIKYGDTINRKGKKDTDKRNAQMIFYTMEHLNNYGIRTDDLKKIVLLAITDKLEKRLLAPKLINQIYD